LAVPHGKTYMRVFVTQILSHYVQTIMCDHEIPGNTVTGEVEGRWITTIGC
jgi:hypothetical protein